MRLIHVVFCQYFCVVHHAAPIIEIVTHHKQDMLLTLYRELRSCELLRNSPEEGSSQLLRCGRLKSRIAIEWFNKGKTVNGLNE
jgi:hypothetical protein